MPVPRMKMAGVTTGTGSVGTAWAVRRKRVHLRRDKEMPLLLLFSERVVIALLPCWGQVVAKQAIGCSKLGGV